MAALLIVDGNADIAERLERVLLLLSIVERHGGTIQAKSEEGAGATFSFTVPVAAPRSEECSAR